MLCCHTKSTVQFRFPTKIQCWHLHFVFLISNLLQTWHFPIWWTFNSQPWLRETVDKDFLNEANDPFTTVFLLPKWSEYPPDHLRGYRIGLAHYSYKLDQFLLAYPHMLSDFSIQFSEKNSYTYTSLTFCNVHYAQFTKSIIIMLKDHMWACSLPLC